MKLIKNITGCCSGSATGVTAKTGSIKEVVRDIYGSLARGGTKGCGCTSFDELQDLSKHMDYTEEELNSLPEGTDMGLGCGNPVAIASLKPGQTVLDLGSGGGIDCFLAARKVGRSGRVIGVDMTPEMVFRAREAVRRSGIENVEFRLGEIEHLPVEDSSVDVIISNCVINLSPDKRQVFGEAYRVLKRGGRLCISDIVALKELPEDMKEDLRLLTGCVAGATEIEELEGLLQEAGFEGVEIEVNEQSREFIRLWFPGKGVEDYIASAIVQAEKDEKGT